MTGRGAMSASSAVNVSSAMNVMRAMVMGVGVSLCLASAGAMAQAQGASQPHHPKETRVLEEGAPEIAKQCLALALDSGENREIEGKAIYDTNAWDYAADELDSGDTFELLVDLLGPGNTKYNLTCQVDADGKVTFDSVETSSTVKSNPGGA
ncbi:hypothetical protein [Salinicola tamaricis]|uniref:hypothetical protein n=1 Tax=Salinicola tamaricis TaxID=1771309 RepID=UPI00101ADF22|nr:hypothetical protein [Salinicola tamaricis]